MMGQLVAALAQFVATGNDGSSAEVVGVGQARSRRRRVVVDVGGQSGVKQTFELRNQHAGAQFC